jgi:hypothetical protein
MFMQDSQSHEREIDHRDAIEDGEQPVILPHPLLHGGDLSLGDVVLPLPAVLCDGHIDAGAVA